MSGFHFLVLQYRLSVFLFYLIPINARERRRRCAGAGALHNPQVAGWLVDRLVSWLVGWLVGWNSQPKIFYLFFYYYYYVLQGVIGGVSGAGGAWGRNE